MPWGGVWEIAPLPITGQPMFDYFFTLVIGFGIAALMLGMAVYVITKN